MTLKGFLVKIQQFGRRIFALIVVLRKNPCIILILA